MTINTAIVFFEKLSKESDDITEIKVYDTFIAVLSELDTKALKPEHRQSIEASLERICVFVAVIGLGLSFGLVAGAYYNAVAYGLFLGMFVGLIIGTSMDSKAKKEGRVLKSVQAN